MKTLFSPWYSVVYPYGGRKKTLAIKATDCTSSLINVAKESREICARNHSGHL